MTAGAFRLELRLRRRTVLLAGLALVAVAALTGALFPAFEDSFSNVALPTGVSDLLGGGDFSTIAGWLNTEIASVYGPLVFIGVGVAAAGATIAGEEEDGILGLVLAHPVPRSRLMLAKGAAIGASILGLGIAAWLGLLLAVELAGGGIGAGRLAALAVHLTGLGLAFGAIALALSAGTGRRGLAVGGTAAIAVLMFLVNGFAPVIDGLHWLKHASLFYWYEGRDPLRTGLHVEGLAVLLAVAAVAVALGVSGFARRDLRG